VKVLLCGCAALALGAAWSGSARADGPLQPGGDRAAATAKVELNSAERAFFSVVGRRMADVAVAYDAYVRGAAAIDPSFDSPRAVQHALSTGSDYQPAQLQEGMIAFAAMIALRDRSFDAAVRSDPDPSLAERLLGAPESVLEIAGAPEAAAVVAGVLRAQGAGLEAKGAAITQAAYTVQRQAWSKAQVADARAVLQRIEASAMTTRGSDARSEKALLVSLQTAPQAADAGGAAPSPAVVRGLALAALTVLGRAGDRNESIIQVLLRDAAEANCLKEVRLELNECLAAAGPHYEDVFCTGRHAVGQTAKCISQAATGGAIGYAVAYEPRRYAPAPAYDRVPDALYDSAIANDADAPAPDGPDEARRRSGYGYGEAGYGETPRPPD